MSNTSLFALILVAVLLADRLVAPSEAHEPQHIIPFRVATVYDGDTITGTAMLWPALTQKIAVRLRGIDAPELRGGCEESKALAVISRTLVDSLLKTAHEVSLLRPTLDKYGGRVVADVLIDGNDLADVLVKRGAVKRWDGRGSRPRWCADKPKEKSSI